MKKKLIGTLLTGVMVAGSVAVPANATETLDGIERLDIVGEEGIENITEEENNEETGTNEDEESDIVDAPPVITTAKDLFLVIKNQVFDFESELGLSIIDDIDGDLTDRVDISPIDVSTPTTIRKTINAKDSSGQTAEKEIVINVVEILTSIKVPTIEDLAVADLSSLVVGNHEMLSVSIQGAITPGEPITLAVTDGLNTVTGLVNVEYTETEPEEEDVIPEDEEDETPEDEEDVDGDGNEEDEDGVDDESEDEDGEEDESETEDEESETEDEEKEESDDTPTPPTSSGTKPPTGSLPQTGIVSIGGISTAMTGLILSIGGLIFKKNKNKQKG